MKKDIAIEVKNIGKQYYIGEKQAYLTFRDLVVSLPKKILNLLVKGKKSQQFWALKNISFKVKTGEVIGIIGKNGAGKSTLLKILAQITEPTTGSISLRGRVASLLEVGTGFKAELTGRENIYLSGAILGMTKKEITEKFDSIVEFSGIEGFLDTPVKRYSSGMYVRLAFAVSAHLNSDILLVDEVLAVGDHEFQEKCLGKMNAISKSGKTVIFVSHNLNSIKNICNKVILLEDGRISQIGPVNKVINNYLSKYIESEEVQQLNYKVNNELTAQIISISKKSTKNKTILDIEFQNRKKQQIYLAYSIQNKLKEIIFFERDFESHKELTKPRKKGKYRYSISFNHNNLISGKYMFEIGIADYIKGTIIDLPTNLLTIEIGNLHHTKHDLPDRGYIKSIFNLKLK